MSDDRARSERPDPLSWAGRASTALYSGLVGVTELGVAVGGRVRRALDRRNSSRLFAGTPCARLTRPDAEPAESAVPSEPPAGAGLRGAAGRTPETGPPPVAGRES